MSATGYSSSWLAERYKADARSRDKNLVAQFVQRLPNKNMLKLVDMGAGLGNNVLYFLDKIQSDIQWYLIEVDANLIQAGIKHLSNFFKDKGDQVTTIPNGLKIQNQYSLYIHYVQSSLYDIRKTQWLAFDGVLANALLDVFSKEQVSQLLQNISISTVPKLFTIIYQDMQWGDADPLNDFFVDKYHAHMQRDQEGVQGLGPSTIEYLENWLSEQNISFLPASSNWELSADDKALIEHLFRFYESSIPEVLTKSIDLEKFKLWLAKKKISMKNGQLTAIVNHVDILL